MRAYGGIGLKEADPQKAKKILHALERVAERTINELVPGNTELAPEDPREQQDHLHVIRELLAMIKRATATGKSDDS